MLSKITDGNTWFVHGRSALNVKLIGIKKYRAELVKAWKIEKSNWSLKIFEKCEFLLIK